MHHREKLEAALHGNGPTFCECVKEHEPKKNSRGR